MRNHYRLAVLRGERIPGWSIDQFSVIGIAIRFHNMAADVFPDREGLVIRYGDGEPAVQAMPVVQSPAEAHAWLTAPLAQALALQKPLADTELVLLERE